MIKPIPVNIFSTFILSFIFLISIPIHGQTTHSQSIKNAYEEIQKIEEMDSKSIDPVLLLKHTYPPYIDLIGGKEKYIEMVQQLMEIGDDEEEEYYEEEEEGPWTLQESREEVSLFNKVYDTGEELQAVIEIKNIDVYTDREEIFKTYDLAISRDGGKFWYFLGSVLWEKVVPNLHPDIVKPDEKEEIVYK